MKQIEIIWVVQILKYKSECGDFNIVNIINIANS